MRIVMALVGFLTLAGCSHGSQRAVDFREIGRDLETIAILGTNDIHGALAPMELRTREPEGGSPPVAYRAGGAAALISYVEELRAEFGPALLWLDGGDQFQGSIESNLAQGEPIIQVLNHAGLDAATVGNHEFDYGPSHASGADPADPLGALKARMTEARFPYLSANIVDSSTGELASNRLPRLSSRKIFNTGRVKVGVFGLTTLETPRSTTGAYVRDLKFTDLKEATLRETAALRADGADLVVAVAHVGARCEKGRAAATSHVRSPLEPQGVCGPHDELVQLLKSVPPGTVDAVVAGHTHQILHHWIAGVPVIQGGAFGRYFNVIYLNYDHAAKKLLPELTRIEGPVPVCPMVFQNQNDCNGERPAPRGGRGPLVPTQFHGTRVSEDSSVRSLLAPAFEKSAEIKKEVIGVAARPIEAERYKESELGDLIADSMRDATGAHVALINTGGVRAGWEQGPITYDAVFRSAPFEDQVLTLRLKGKELKQLLRIAESGSRGFCSTSGVRLRIVSLEEDPKGSDLNGNGRIEAWEVDRLLHVELENGDPIEDGKEYRLATIDFLVNGGDDLGWFMSSLPANRREPSVGLMRDILVQWVKNLSKTGPINQVDHPIINSASPRLHFEKTKGKGKGGKGRRHHRRRR